MAAAAPAPTTHPAGRPDGRTDGPTFRPRVVVVGAGVSGIAQAVLLDRDGLADVVVYEKADRVGGTWRDNTYPGLHCDVPSRYYSFSFAPHPGWSRVFAPGHEIRDYLEGVVDRFGLRDRIRFGVGVEQATWHDDGWHLVLDDGTHDRADVLVCATGVLRDPVVPDVPGLDDFAGEVFHTARWDHDVRLAGQRVGVVGTGSSGVQVTTALAGVASPLTMFVRHPQWVLALPNLAYTSLGEALHRWVPGLGRMAHRGWQAVFEHSMAHAATRPGLRRRLVHALCRAQLRTIADGDLQAALTPDDDPLCKRLIISGGFHRAVQRDDVEVVRSGLARVVPEGVVDDDGRLHELDVLVLATGFHAQRFVRPMAVTGRDGVTLDDAWADGPRGYLTVAVPDFPNFFLLQGPHSPTGNQSLIETAEVQAGYVRRCVAIVGREQVAMGPTHEATRAFNEAVAAELPRTAWTSGCDSWYLDASGNPTLWPWLAQEHRGRLASPRLEDFEVVPLVAPAEAVAG